MHPYLPHEEEPEHIKNRTHFEREHARPLWRQALTILGAVIVLVGMVSLSGVRQFLFFSRTPAHIAQPQLQQLVPGNIIAVPLAVIVFTSEELSGGSLRGRADVERLATRATNIWVQAGITVSVRSFRRVELSGEALRVLRADPVGFVGAFSQTQTSGMVQAFFVHDLAGINGVAYGSGGAIAVADLTSVLDFRVLAHEIGHVLGLGHVNDPLRLMHSGANGTALTPQEARAARATAQRILWRTGHFTLTELRDHSRPDDEVFKELNL